MHPDSGIASVRLRLVRRDPAGKANRLPSVNRDSNADRRDTLLK